MITIHRSDAGRDAVRASCVEKIDRADAAREVLDVDGIAVNVTRFGSGPTRVVFLPGTAMCAATSIPLATALAEHWGTAVIDLPGQPGLSDPRRPARPRPAWYASVVDTAMTMIGTSRAAVIGHSLGAAVALAMRSDAVAGRLLCSPAGIVGLRVTPTMGWRSAAWLAASTPARAERMLRPFTAPGKRPDPDLVEWMGLVGRHCRSTLAPAPLPDATLAAVTGPTRVAVGRHDTFLPVGRLRPAVERRLGLRLRVVDGAGHLLTDERPDAVVDLAAGLIGAIDAA